MKSSKHLYLHRLRTIVKFLTMGYIRRNIYDILRNSETEKKDWDISYSQFNKYCKKAVEIISKSYRNKYSYFVGRGVARYDLLFTKLYNNEDYRGAAEMQSKLERLLALSPKENNTNSIDDNEQFNTISFSKYQEDIDTLLHKILHD